MITDHAVPNALRRRAGAAHRTRLWDLAEVRWATLASALFLAGLAASLTGLPDWTWWTLYLACYAAGGWEPGLAGLQALREKTLDVDLLMVVAAIGAAVIGQVFDGALLIVIFATSGALEAFATARTEDSVRGLLHLAPDTATVLGPDGERDVDAAELQIGDRILVRPGDRIAADGTVVSGVSDVDQATITGEPLPIDKRVGDDVFAGTLNGSGTLTVRVERLAGDSVVARIADMVAQASQTKAGAQLFVEKVEQRYSLGMVVCTLAVFAVPLAVGADLQSSLLRAMTFMIVASPCAVVLATMPPLLAAIAHAGRRGVLVKSAVVMERLAAVDAVAFDKTGTLTTGRPVVNEVWSVDGDPDQVVASAAALERVSEHPLAAAVVAEADRRGLAVTAATEFAAHAGAGVSGRVAGRRVTVMAPRGHRGILAPEARDAIDRMQADGMTVVVVGMDEVAIGLLGFTDAVRVEAADTVVSLTALGASTVLLTGDNAQSARRVATEVGIADVRADLLPQDKTAAVVALQGGGRSVAMVGDGVNDAPALAASTAGIALGGVGSDLALQAADVVIVRDQLSAVPATLAFARRARRVVVANLVIAATFIGVLVIWNLVGTLPLPLGVAGHEGSTVIVGLNGLRLLHRSAWPRAAVR
ncbi:heavy metal translocating P-type ATPase [Gordonia hydrophobica]|uniref:Heavy metal translocating P-type ATPase n=1 Tax=Gordonia hydrophobica TaxID=40516 RepID=A0ABZ2U786_9ACTN|nr:heavy metal translocating P-type ATPase [Gordonia hydrophobica]